MVAKISPAPPPPHAAVPEKRRPPKAAELVAEELRRQIVTGKLKPGDKLVPENVLQEEFAISRPTMREALRILESESLITIGRGKHGGARVTSIDLASVARQVGAFLQIERTTLQDVWLARTVIEPPAAGIVAAQRNPAAIEALEANIAEARHAAEHDLLRYADLSADFSLLIALHSGNRTLYLLARLIHDIIRRQHEHVTQRTSAKASVAVLRQESLRSREHVVELMRRGAATAAERFWREHIEHMRDLVLAAYPGPVTIDVLSEPLAKARAGARPKRLSLVRP